MSTVRPTVGGVECKRAAWRMAAAAAAAADFPQFMGGDMVVVKEDESPRLLV